MFGKRLAGGLLALTLGLAACGNDAGPDEPLAAAQGQQAAAAPETAAPAAPTQNGVAASALLGNSDLGQILVGPDGRSLYGFTNDTQAASTCYGGCAEAWPPVIVDQDWTVGPGLDLGIFATTVRDDGSLQLVAGKWPLYYYAGDAVPGDINGQDSGEVWFLVEPGGRLITDGEASSNPAGESDGEATTESGDAAAVVGTGETDLGTVLIDEAGLTLYGFTNDTDGVPSCDDACAEAWPPVIVDALPEGLDPAVFSITPRTDGTMQLVAGKWPLYRFAGDAQPGDINGQGSGGVWWVAAPDGSLINDGATPSADADADAGGGAETTSDSGDDSNGY